MSRRKAAKQRQAPRLRVVSGEPEPTVEALKARSDKLKAEALEAEREALHALGRQIGRDRDEQEARQRLELRLATDDERRRLGRYSATLGDTIARALTGLDIRSVAQSLAVSTCRQLASELAVVRTALLHLDYQAAGMVTVAHCDRHDIARVLAALQYRAAAADDLDRPLAKANPQVKP